MASSESNVLRRDRETRANINYIKQMLGITSRGFFFRRKTTLQPHISDHLARDIGLTPSEIELARFKLPSQTTYHPRG